ncbi:MAG: hypothetical protein L0Z62_26810 [Gemmataceae bacterium]|nr:hypothetical protein [Gemmataceae bacterium]
MPPTGTPPLCRPDRDLCSLRTGRAGCTAVCCAVTARAALNVSLDTLPELRKAAHPSTGEPLAPTLLKNADEQTVAGLAAVSEAVRASGLRGHELSGWGVVAAPRFLGRSVMGHVLHRFREEGAWGISPHIIPHRSLHAVSGTVSQILKLHGPNIGVGGGPGAESEALLTAAALLSDGMLPGVWVILTGHDPEPIPEDPAIPGLPSPLLCAPPVCVAVALGLAQAPPAEGRLRLTVGMGTPVEAAPRPELTLTSLQEALAGGGEGAWRLSCGGWAELRQAPAESDP